MSACNHFVSFDLYTFTYRALCDKNSAEVLHSFCQNRNGLELAVHVMNKTWAGCFIVN